MSHYSLEIRQSTCPRTQHNPNVLQESRNCHFERKYPNYSQLTASTLSKLSKSVKTQNRFSINACI